MPSLLAACAPPERSGTEPTGANATPSAAAVEKIEVAFCAVPYCIIPFEAANRLGYFRQEGLEVTFLYLGPAPSMEALLDGTVDFAGTPLSMFPVVPSAGKPLTMVANVSAASMGMLLANPASPGVQTLKDLAGKRIAGALPNAPPGHLTTWSALARQGVDPGSVQFVPQPSGGCDGIAASDVDAAYVQEPCQTQLLRGGWRTLASFGTLSEYDTYVGGHIPHMALLTRPDVLQKRPETVRKLARALVAANRWLRVTPGARIVETLPQVFGNDGVIYAAGLDRFKADLYPVDVATSPGSIQRMLDVMRAARVIPADSPLRAEDLFTNAYLPR